MRNTLHSTSTHCVRRAVMAVAALAGTAITPVMVAAPPAAAVTTTTLTVATTGSDTGNCVIAPCATLGYAISQATAGSTILIEPGTYLESKNPSGISDTVPATLPGLIIASDSAKGGTATNTIIDAAGEANGIVVQANGVTVSGLTFENANLEGILVEPPPSTWPASATAPAANITDVTISRNVVQFNDKAFDVSAHVCPSSLTDADDCGEGLHLMAATNSTVSDNTVTHNVGGILLSDGGLPGPGHGPISIGPAAHNTISGNTVDNNLYDCGITLPGHDPRAVATSGPNIGKPQPTLAGVYDNTVTGNTSDNNGFAGILLATPYPGTASYDNTITGNTASGNREPGVTMHEHAVLQDLNGNVIKNNTLPGNGTAGTGGGPSDTNGPPSYANVQDSVNMDILAVYEPVTGTVVQNNTMSGSWYGVWMSPLAARGTTLSGNSVSVPPGGTAVYTEPPEGSGYEMVGSDGGVFSFGAASYHGSLPGLGIRVNNIVGMAPTPDYGGYWLVGSDGGVFAFGDAPFLGSMGGIKLNAPVVGMAPGAYAINPTTGATTDTGYWEVASDGGVFSFGKAAFLGSMGGVKLNAPVVGIMGGPLSIDPATFTETASGYWEVASDGGVFSFGSSSYMGSMGGIKLNAPVVGGSSV